MSSIYLPGKFSFLSLQKEDSLYSAQSPYSLEYLYASLFATILEDTLTEMRILGECNNALRNIKAMSDIMDLRAKKYSVVQPPKDELDGIDPKKLWKEEYKLDKLSTDRKFLFDSILTTYLGLSLNKNYQGLVDQVNCIVDRDDYRVNLLEDEAKNKTSRRELGKQLRLQRNHFKSVIYDVDVTIENLRTQVEDASLNAEVTSRYISNWERARTEQHLQKIDDKEAVPLNNIETFKMKVDNEQRVHTEIDLLNNIRINETLDKVEKMMNKYEKDMERIDLKIQIMKNNHTNEYERRIELEETYAKHDKLAKDWQHFKDEREKARQYREKMTNAAVSVQAWWRGLLVRNQLGPYKPLKRPPPPPAKGKKK